MVPNPQNRGAVLPTDLLFIQANILIDEGGHARLASVVRVTDHQQNPLLIRGATRCYPSDTRPGSRTFA